MEYRSTLSGVGPEHLAAFFEGWPNPPNPETHLRLLQGSYALALVWCEDEQRVIGFANAISDGVLTAYIPLLEVLPEHRGQGIGKKLIKNLMDQLSELYMVDIVCDPDLESFYEPLGFVPLLGMAHRNYERQNGSIT